MSTVVSGVGPKRASLDPHNEPDDRAWESPEGIDLSLIHWSLNLTPTQRLEVLEDFVGTAEALRRGRRS